MLTISTLYLRLHQCFSPCQALFSFSTGIPTDQVPRGRKEGRRKDWLWYWDKKLGRLSCRRQKELELFVSRSHGRLRRNFWHGSEKRNLKWEEGFFSDK
jgi:hypothetical protein